MSDLDIKKGHRARLISKFLENPQAFTSVEIIELLLFLSIPRKDTKTIAKILNQKSKGNLISLFAMSSEQLKTIDGLGNNTILNFKLIYELAIRITKEKILNKNCLTCFDDIIDYCKINIIDKNQEELRVLFLNVKNYIIYDEVMFKGSLSCVNVYPREIVGKCIENGASGIILVHNHPSGDPTPSKEDIDLTKNIFKILQPIGINLIDHLIVTPKNNFVSFRLNKIAPFE